MVEEHEVQRAGGSHRREFKGPDGHMPCGNVQEIKSQRWVGNYTLRGRGKFGSPSYRLYDAKVESNELVTIIGYHETSGELYYRFTFNFDAVATHYRHAVDMGWHNYDTIPVHYADHQSFNVEYVADGKVLERDSEFFQPKFFNFLGKCK